MKVRATRRGFVGQLLRRPGDVFEIPEAAFSARWMEVVDESTPEPRASAQQASDDAHAALSPFGESRRSTWPAEDSSDVLADGDPFN